MSELPPSSEAIEITDDLVVEALRVGTNNPEAQSTFERWYRALRDNLDAIYAASGRESLAVASLECAIRRALVYYKAGHIEEAVADLEETCDAACSNIFKGTGLYEQASSVLNRMKAGESM